jgi:hypothetical protein
MSSAVTDFLYQDLYMLRILLIDHYQAKTAETLQVRHADDRTVTTKYIFMYNDGLER